MSTTESRQSELPQPDPGRLLIRQYACGMTAINQLRQALYASYQDNNRANTARLYTVVMDALAAAGIEPLELA